MSYREIIKVYVMPLDNPHYMAAADAEFECVKTFGDLTEGERCIAQGLIVQKQKNLGVTADGHYYEIDKRQYIITF